MNTHEKMLKIMGHGVSIFGWRPMQQVRHLWGQGALRLIRSESCRGWGYPFEDENSTSSYEECLRVRVDFNGRLTLIVHDGDLYNGFPKEKRAEFDFEGDWSSISELTRAIERAYKEHTMRVLIDEEEAAREARRKEIADRLLAEVVVDELESVK